MLFRSPRTGGAAITQQPGSYERWLVNGSRWAAGGSYTAPTGVGIQIAQSQMTSGTLTLTNGGIEPYMYVDDWSLAANRVVGAGVTINLVGDNTIGQSFSAPGLNSSGAGSGIMGRTGVPYPVGMNPNFTFNNPLAEIGRAHV